MVLCLDRLEIYGPCLLCAARPRVALRARRPAFPNRESSASSCRMLSSAATHASGSSGDRRTAAPAAISRSAGMSAATTGVSCAIASRTGIPKPSCRLGNANTSAPRYSAPNTGSPTRPRVRTRSPRRRAARARTPRPPANRPAPRARAGAGGRCAAPSARTRRRAARRSCAARGSRSRTRTARHRVRSRGGWLPPARPRRSRGRHRSGRLAFALAESPCT